MKEYTKKWLDVYVANSCRLTKLKNIKIFIDKEEDIYLMLNDNEMSLTKIMTKNLCMIDSKCQKKERNLKSSTRNFILKK